MIGAANRSAPWIKAATHRQRCAAVRASISKSEHLAAVAEQHNLFAQKSYCFWFVAQSPPRDSRLPVVAQSKSRKFALVIAFLKCLVQVCLLFRSRPNLKRRQRQFLRRYSRRHRSQSAKTSKFGSTRSIRFSFTRGHYRGPR